MMVSLIKRLLLRSGLNASQIERLREVRRKISRIEEWIARERQSRRYEKEAKLIKAELQRLWGHHNLQKPESKEGIRKVLALFWKDNPAVPGLPSNENHNLYGSLKESGLATCVCCYYDETLGGLTFLEKAIVLMEHIISAAPDLIIVSSYIYNNSRMPNWEVFRFVHMYFKIPIIVFCWDTVGKKSIPNNILPLAQETNRFIFIDSRVSYLPYPIKKQCVPAWAPQDPTLYNNPNYERVIDVSFLGSTTAYRGMRETYLGYLSQVGISVFRSSGALEDRISDAEYADIFKKSKISINFAFSTNNTVQLKGRIFEVMLCGALLLESENDEIQRYFIPFEDYVPFKDPEDLAQKIKYYLEHDEERERIARNGYLKASENHNCKAFWSMVFQSVDASE